ncbi:MAG: hypothetical protein LBT36_00965 [Oscillospiraceae bacterium]|jgi:hypothetical protein|nr:hypothetical protein [Oscillospiraceae bacterium]
MKTQHYPIALLLCASLTAYAFGASAAKTIEVFTGVSIFIDDTKLNPTDVNGAPVEACVYNATTICPCAR